MLAMERKKGLQLYSVPIRGDGSCFRDSLECCS